MKNVEIGDRFKRGNDVYILCRMKGCYYLVNLKTGAIWTSGLTFECLIDELKAEGFEKIK